MRDKHYYYNQLDEKTKECLDKAFENFSRYLQRNGIKVAMDDRAEECINEMSKFIIGSMEKDIEQEDHTT